MKIRLIPPVGMPPLILIVVERVHLFRHAI